MGTTIFSKILSGDIPCHRVYEDEWVLAFLDINPLSPGHTLVIPKEAAATIDALRDESSAAIGRVLPRIARSIMKITGIEDYNILQNNGAYAHQAVFHVHYHIIPKTGDHGLGVKWQPSSLSKEAGAELATKIAASIS